MCDVRGEECLAFVVRDATGVLATTTDADLVRIDIGSGCCRRICRCLWMEAGTICRASSNLTHLVGVAIRLWIASGYFAFAITRAANILAIVALAIIKRGTVGAGRTAGDAATFSRACIPGLGTRVTCRTGYAGSALTIRPCQCAIRIHRADGVADTIRAGQLGYGCICTTLGIGLKAIYVCSRVGRRGAGVFPIGTVRG